MADFASRARLWVSKLFGGGGADAVADAGVDTAMDGISAVGALEALAGGRLPVTVGGARAELAEAIGAALAGQRATAWLDTGDLASVHDLLSWSAERSLPMVAWVRGEADHAGLHAVADAGWVILVARNVQEAVDLGLVARRLAEESLVPVLVVMEQRGAAVHSLTMVAPKTVQALLGAAQDQITCALPGQRLMFGAQRRRVPRWHDLDAPAMSGAVQGPQVRGASLAARDVYVNDLVEARLYESCRSVSARTGRDIGPLALSGVDGAKLVVVAMGEAAETAEAAARWLREERKLKVGVVSVLSLRPFPRAALAQALEGASALVVMERASGAMAGYAPLSREVRASLKGRSIPLSTVVFGRGGQPLRGADLVAAIEECADGGRPLIYLGTSFAPPASRLPKRQAHLDALRHVSDKAAELGLVVDGDGPDLRTAGALNFAVVRRATDTSLTAALARQLQGSLGGQVRTHLSAYTGEGDDAHVDRVSWAASGLPGMADDATVDLVVLPALAGRAGEGIALAERAAVLVAAVPTGEGAVEDEIFDDEVWAALHPSLQQAVLKADGELFVVASPDHLEDRVMGAVLGVLKERGLTWKERLAIDTRQAAGADQAGVAAFSEAVEAVYSLQAAEIEAVPARLGSPEAVKELAGEDGPMALAPFWDRIGVLYAHDTGEAMVPDPALAVGQVPALAATFGQRVSEHDVLPRIDHAACTGCGGCWSACPEGALGVSALQPKAMLDAAISLSGRSGTPADALRPVSSQIAATVSKRMRKGETTAGDFADAFTEALEVVLDKGNITGDRRDSMIAAMQGVVRAVGALPLAATDTFLRAAESKAKGSGALLSIVVDADTCTACGLCASACDVDAIEMVAAEADVVQQDRAAWAAWAALPDTPGALIADTWDDAEVGPMAATLLSRHALMAMAGVDAAEPGSGEKLALRWSLAMAEASGQQSLSGLLTELSELRGSLADAIRGLVAGVLPTEDLDALSQTLAAEARADLKIGDLLSSMDAIRKDKTRLLPADAARLRRLAAASEALAAIEARVSGGLGRARMGLVLDHDLARRWAGRFPKNPFQAPAVVAGAGELAALGRGLTEGQVAAVAEDLAWIERARLELDKPADAARAGAVRGASWSALPVQARQRVAPVFIVGDDSLLSDAATVDLVAAGLPAVILILSQADVAVARAGELAMLDLGRLGAHVLQGSLAAPGHLAAGLAKALTHKGPVIIRVHAPSPSRHGFAADATLARAEAALATRAWPLFQYDPTAEGVFGSRLSLAGNQGVELEADPESLVLWALDEGRYRELLEPVADGAPSPTAAVSMFKGDVSGKTPVVELAGQRLAMPVSLLRGLRGRAELWQTLRELAGVVTPFTEAVRAQVQAELAAGHQAELDAQKADFEARLAAQAADYEAQAVARVRDGLMRLVARAPARGEG